MYEKKGVSKTGETSPKPYLIQCKGLHKSAGFVEATICMKKQGLTQNSRDFLEIISYSIKKS
jgi:hypothetical protein